jgi:hypothetical protein
MELSIAMCHEKTDRQFDRQFDGQLAWALRTSIGT